MKLREVIVKNFHCLKRMKGFRLLIVPVFVGETTPARLLLLDALRDRVDRYPRGRQRRQPFREYDYHMIAADDSPKKSDL